MVSKRLKLLHLAEGCMERGGRQDINSGSFRNRKQMVRNCQEATWEDREFHQKPLEYNQKKAFLKAKMSFEVS